MSPTPQPPRLVVIIRSKGLLTRSGGSAGSVRASVHQGKDGVRRLADHRRFPNLVIGWSVVPFQREIGIGCFARSTAASLLPIVFTTCSFREFTFRSRRAPGLTLARVVVVVTKKTPRIVDAFGMPGLFVTRFSGPCSPILANAYMLCGPFPGREANDGRRNPESIKWVWHDARLCGVSWMPQALLFDSAPHFHFQPLPTSPFVLSNSFFIRYVITGRCLVDGEPGVVQSLFLRALFWTVATLSSTIHNNNPSFGGSSCTDTPVFFLFM